MINPLKLIPPQYKLLAYGLILVIVVGAVFGSGAWSGHKVTKDHYTAIISEMEADVAQYEASKAKLETDLANALANVREVIVTKYVDRVRTVKVKEYVYVTQAENDVPDRNELSNGWVYLHDQSARGEDATSAGSSDATGSGVAANQALSVVVQNYSVCKQNAEQLTALQEYVREAERVVAEANQLVQELTKKKK